MSITHGETGNFLAGYLAADASAPQAEQMAAQAAGHAGHGLHVATVAISMPPNKLIPTDMYGRLLSRAEIARIERYAQQQARGGTLGRDGLSIAQDA